MIPEVTGKMINFERRRKQWDIFRVFEIHQGHPYTFEYDGTCGGYLYRAEILPMEDIEAKPSAISRPGPPDCRPEIIDIHKNYQASANDTNDLGVVVEDDVRILSAFFSNMFNLHFFRRAFKPMSHRMKPLWPRLRPTCWIFLPTKLTCLSISSHNPSPLLRLN